MTLTAHCGDPKMGRSKARREMSGGTLRATVDVADTGKDCLTVTIVLKSKARTQSIAGQPPIYRVKLKQQVERLVDGLITAPRPTAKLARLANRIEHAGATEREPVRTKTPRSTIGVSSCLSFHKELERMADENGVPLASTARDCFERGLNLLEKRLWDESSQTVFKELSEAYRRFDAEEKIQWSLRISRQSYIKGVLLAREHGISQSQLACLCMSAALDMHAIA